MRPCKRVSTDWMNPSMTENDFRCEVIDRLVLLNKTRDESIPYLCAILAWEIMQPHDMPIHDAMQIAIMETPMHYERQQGIGLAVAFKVRNYIQIYPGYPRPGIAKNPPDIPEGSNE